MHITRITLYRLSIPLKEPFIISLGTIKNVQNVIVRIETSIGITGMGECSPFLTIHGESQDTCMSMGNLLGQQLIGVSPLNIEACISIMDTAIYGNSSIKSAFDMALYDIASQQAQLPLYKFLGGKNDKIIVTDYTVSIGDPYKMAQDALKIKDAGFPVIKVKLGKNGKEDVKRIAAIRQAVGYDIPIRIDANQGWHVDEAIATLNLLKPFDIQHCEEPINRKKFTYLPKIKQHSSIPIMADESCCDVYDAQRLIDINACTRINLKIGKSGGIFNALKILNVAQQNAMPVQIGAFMESRLAMTAFAHVALTSPMVQYYDFDTALMFTQDNVSGGIEYGAGGVITVPEVAGIGATINQDVLNTLECIEIK